MSWKLQHTTATEAARYESATVGGYALVDPDGDRYAFIDHDGLEAAEQDIADEVDAAQTALDEANERRMYFVGAINAINANQSH